MNYKHFIRSLAFIVMLLSAGKVAAQKSPLSREVTVNAPGISLQDALLLLGEETSMNFSYNSSLIDKNRKVDINTHHEKLGSVLDDIIEEEIMYKVVGNHIVLLADNTPKVSKKEVVKTGYSISGYIYDSFTGKVIRSATIYDVGGERSSLTDHEGFYSILVPPGDDFKGLSYCKEGYLDTVIIVKPAENLTLDMRLRPRIVEDEIALQPFTEERPEIELEKPTFNTHRIVDAVIPTDALSHSNNLVLYEHKIGQVSFLPLPGIRTSRNGVYINRFSLNILAGYTGGVDGVEIGGLLNVDRNYVNGVQVAGFGNIVGKKTSGVQLAGFTNINIGSITGIQVAGFNNVTNDTITGMQVAGFTNYLRGAMNGVQMSGFYNHLVDGAYGVQAAGFVNYAGRDFKGAQLAGFANVAIDSIYGAQVAGFSNFQRGAMTGAQVSGFGNISLGKVSGGQVSGFANLSSGEVIGGQVAGFANVALGEIDGVQVAGFCNYVNEADSGIQVAGFANLSVSDYKGVQVAGFMNMARDFEGLQVGTFNFSESSEGYSIGFFNYVRNGYRAIELSSDEVLLANLTYKTGNRKLYNIFNIGVHPIHDSWGVGLGFGSYTSLGKKFHIFQEIVSNAINEGVAWQQHINLQNKISLGLDYQLIDHVALFASAAFNVHVLGRDRDSNAFQTEVPLLPFYSHDGVNVQTNMWIGGRLGIRLILHQ